MMLAAICLTKTTGVTFLAVDIGFYTATISDANIFNVVCNLDNFNPKLMARDSRVTKKRHFSEVSTIVGTAYANCFNADKSLARL
jgi:hypothetical protein